MADDHLARDDAHPHEDGDSLPPSLADELRTLYLQRPHPSTEERHVAAMVAAAGRSPATHRRRLWAGALAAAVVGLGGLGGLAGAGALPAPVQDAVSSVAAKVGIDLPRADESDVDREPGAPEHERGREVGPTAPPATEPSEGRSSPSATTPGQSGDAPGRGGTEPGRSEDAPGREVAPNGPPSTVPARPDPPNPTPGPPADRPGRQPAPPAPSGPPDGAPGPPEGAPGPPSDLPVGPPAEPGSPPHSSPPGGPSGG